MLRAPDRIAQRADSFNLAGNDITDLQITPAHHVVS
jgi:hypothetical protein